VATNLVNNAIACGDIVFFVPICQSVPMLCVCVRPKSQTIVQVCSLHIIAFLHTVLTLLIYGLNCLCFLVCEYYYYFIFIIIIVSIIYLLPCHGEIRLLS